jgi:hypothetical protein
VPVLKARIGGTWVDVGGGGADEVWVGPDTPTDANNELWIDTDEADLTDPNVARWNSAWGIVGAAYATASQNNITTLVDLTDLRVTFTPVAGRRYRADFGGVIYATGSGIMDVHITDAAGGIIGSANGGLAGGFVPWPTLITQPFTGIAGAPYTVKARASMSSNALNTAPSGTNPMHLIVEDVGPVSLASNPPAQPASVWTALPLLNGWANRGGGQRTARYRLVGDIVYVEGRIQTAAAQAAYTQFATLPVGFRPPEDIMFPEMYYNSGPQVSAEIFVRPTGVMNINVPAVPAAGSDGSINCSFSVTA